MAVEWPLHSPNITIINILLGAEGLKAALTATDDSTKSTHSNSEIDGKLFFPIFSPVKN